MTDTTTTPATLDELLTVLRAAPSDEIDQIAYAEAHGLPTAPQGIEWAELPTYGGNAPTDTRGIWSWDATRLLVGEGRADLAIVGRDEWDQ